jgi:DNA mismatch repair protein MutL
MIFWSGLRYDVIMKRIQILKEEVINQIAAGEVIERPASVVKELVENSVDAGATKIEVEVAQGGRYVRVSDNGSGIHPADIKLAFSRHATSKIESEKDLWGLHTLGFRGEALASILSISKLSCTTKTKEADDGVKATKLDSGDIDYSPVGCSTGTTFEIKELFYNVPARLKFMKSSRAEVSAIIEVLQNLAITNPEVAFICLHQGKTVLKTSGSADLSITLSEIFSKDLLNHLLIVNAIDEKQKYFASGVMSDPTFTKSNRKSIYTIINNRFVKCPIITKAIERAFEDVLPGGRFPLAIINFMMPPEQLDVNVHPTKREVKYVATNSVFSFIHYSVKKALQDSEYYIKKQLTEKVLEEEDLEQSVRQEEHSDILSKIPLVKTEKIDHKPETSSPIQATPVSIHNKQIEKEKHSAETAEKAMEFYKPLENQKASLLSLAQANPPVPPEQLKIDSALTFPQKPEKKPWTVIGQVFNTYIVLQTDTGLQIVDQHIASERAIYDRLKSADQQIAGQRLLIFNEIDIDTSAIALLEEHKEHLSRWGYEIEISEANKVLLKQIPQMLTGRNQSSAIEEIITHLEKYSSIEILEDNILKTLSCHAAVRAGDVLSYKEMEQVIIQWQCSTYPFTCPHGRKIAHTIGLKELAGYFDRQPNYI